MTAEGVQNVRVDRSSSRVVHDYTPALDVTHMPYTVIHETARLSSFSCLLGATVVILSNASMLHCVT